MEGGGVLTLRNMTGFAAPSTPSGSGSYRTSILILAVLYSDNDMISSADSTAARSSDPWPTPAITPTQLGWNRSVCRGDDDSDGGGGGGGPGSDPGEAAGEVAGSEAGAAGAAGAGEDVLHQHALRRPGMGSSKTLCKGWQGQQGQQ